MLVPIAAEFVLCGCVSQRKSTAEFAATSAQVVHEQDGLRLTVERVDDPARLNALFGDDDLGQNVVAVHVAVSNESLAREYIVRRDSFAIAGGADAAPSRSDPGAEGVETVGLVLVSPLLISLGMGAQGNASVVQSNMLTREFKTVTLLPGDSARGFVFFSLKPEQRARGCVFHATPSIAGTNQRINIDLQF